MERPQDSLERVNDPISDTAGFRQNATPANLFLCLEYKAHRAK